MKVRKFRYFMGDFETTVYQGQLNTEVWASAVVELNTEDVKIFHSIGDTFEYLKSLDSDMFNYGDHRDWIETCDIIRRELAIYDNNIVIDEISVLLKLLPSHYIITSDVGNNEFWVSRACVNIRLLNRAYYSKSFGALGCGIGKAIGIHYATRQPILCFVGDQGFQMNIQELQFVRQHSLPICLVILNNKTSGMIKDRESSMYGRYVHTTKDSGYWTPRFKDVADGYGLPYFRFDHLENKELAAIFENENLPAMIEIVVDENLGLSPNLPQGCKCDNMQPQLPKDLIKKLQSL